MFHRKTWKYWNVIFFEYEVLKIYLKIKIEKSPNCFVMSINYNSLANAPYRGVHSLDTCEMEQILLSR